MIKILLLNLIHFLLKVFYIFPVKKDHVLYMSFEGAAYTCNPKYLYKYLSKDKRLKHVWVLNKDSQKQELLNKPNVNIIPYKSFKFFYYMLTSKVIITNNISISYIPYRKKQFVVGTWHGGGAYKKVGYDINKDDYQKHLYKKLSKNVDYMLSSCQKFSNAMQNAYFIDKEKFINSGLPRNDCLINSKSNSVETQSKKALLKEKIAKHYSFDKNKNIALYAPTFRGNFNAPITEIKNIYNIDIKNLRNSLSKRFGADFIVLFRAHYYLSDLNLFDKQVINVSDYPDMQELLLISDVLINDYSSSMWDFSLTGKPVFIYASDRKQYINDRDFYTPINDWPFQVAENNDELSDIISNFDNQEYLTNVAQHHIDLGSFEQGNATDIVGNILLSHLESDLYE